MFIPFAPAIFAGFGHDDEILALEVDYFRIMCLGTFPLLLGTTLACFYSGRGKTVVIMVVEHHRHGRQHRARLRADLRQVWISANGHSTAPRSRRSRPSP